MSKTANAPKTAFERLQGVCFGSSGLSGSLSGMRKLYWGKDAYVVRCCGYLFLVSYDVFTYYKYGRRL